MEKNNKFKMEELIDIDYDKDKLKNIKETVNNKDKKDKKEIAMTKEEKKIIKKYKLQKYIILILFFVILFILYHLLLQYSENLQNSVNIQEKLILNYEENLKGRERELNLSIYENDKLKEEIYQLQMKYATYAKENKILKEENDKIVKSLEELVKINQRYRTKYNKYKEYFQNLSETFHSFFEK